MPSAISSSVAEVSQAGATNINSAQASVTTTAAQLVPANSTRRGVTVLNMDPKEPIYIGKDNTITSLTGLRLTGGQSISIDTVSAIFAIAGSGTRQAAYLEEYD